MTECKEKSDVYIRLIFEAGKIKYVFELEKMEIVIDFLLVVDQYISDVYKDKSVDETVLRDVYTKLYREEILDKLESQLKI